MMSGIKRAITFLGGGWYASLIWLVALNINNYPVEGGAVPAWLAMSMMLLIVLSIYIASRIINCLVEHWNDD